MIVSTYNKKVLKHRLKGKTLICFKSKKLNVRILTFSYFIKFFAFYPYFINFSDYYNTNVSDREGDNATPTDKIVFFHYYCSA